MQFVNHPLTPNQCQVLTNSGRYPLKDDRGLTNCTQLQSVTTYNMNYILSDYKLDKILIKISIRNKVTTDWL